MITPQISGMVFRHTRILITGVIVFVLAFTALATYRFGHGTIDGLGFPAVRSGFDWENRRLRYPIPDSELMRLPKGTPKDLPRVQHDFASKPPSPEFRAKQEERRQAVKAAFVKGWNSYKRYAWGFDELAPLSREGVNPFNGWAATMVDSLDTLWIMGLRDEFYEAVRYVATIDWDESETDDLSVFETNIRYLGGLLAAFDLSQERVLLMKAVELANMLYAAFDNPLHLPASDFNIPLAKKGKLMPTLVSAAGIGTLSMEFTRLAQLTGDDKFYDAITRIKIFLAAHQEESQLPGMWPTKFDISDGFMPVNNGFSLGGSQDSLYEYLVKMYPLLGGLDPDYEKLYKRSMEVVDEHLLFRPVVPDNDPDILFTGAVRFGGGTKLFVPEWGHLECFAGGMYQLGGRLFNNEKHVETGDKLARGCAWAYQAMPSGVMPEKFEAIPCASLERKKCKWDEEQWEEKGILEVPRGFAKIKDNRYIMRPEAIESIFISWRITGAKDLQDIGWAMWQGIMNTTETEIANAAVEGVNTDHPVQTDSLESFWFAETTKYFYLLYSEPELISLDDYVFNTEAHPFLRPKPPTDKAGSG